MNEIKEYSKWLYNFLKWDKWHVLAFVGVFLMIFCTKQIAAEMYNYQDLTAESKASFLKNIKTVNFSINSYGYTFKYHCGGSWNNSEFTPSTSGKPHVLGDVMSYVREQDKVEVIKFLSAECS